MSAPPLLWHLPISHFNEKVRWALDWKRIPHVRRALGASYIARALWATGQPRLPVLFLEGRAIADSTRIIEALERHRPEPPLYPRDEPGRRRALALEDFFDEGLGPAVRAATLGPSFVNDPAATIRLLTTGMAVGRVVPYAPRAAVVAFRAFYRARHDINAATVAEGRAKVRAALDRLEAELGPSGYLVGDAFTVADLTAAALFAPLLFPPEFPYPPAGPVLPAIGELRAFLGDRPGLAWVLDTYRRHRGTSAEVAP